MTIDAHWLWDNGDPRPCNAMMQFRRAFHLEHAPQTTQLHISADSRYLLYVNGLRIGYGRACAKSLDKH